jgi:hypothetical protein
LTLPGVTSAPVDGLPAIAAAAAAVAVAQADLDAAVERGRWLFRRDCSWPAIGEAVGLSAEGAKYRWGRVRG